MPYTKIPRDHCFALSDFKEFNNCTFSFFVKHNLGKKYELAEGNENQAIGSLLDLTIKKLHQVKSYGQPVENLYLLIKASEIEIREAVMRNGPFSFYGPQIPFLKSETIAKAKDIFKQYYQGLEGKIRPSLSTTTFWELVLPTNPLVKIWGGPDALELGDDGVPEIADYKYIENEAGKERLDMDLMPKLYCLLCAKELLSLGYESARFIIRFWQDPGDDSYSVKFSLSEMNEVLEVFKEKIETILKTNQATFCKNKYCKVCNSDQKEGWVNELKTLGISVVENNSII